MSERYEHQSRLFSLTRPRKGWRQSVNVGGVRFERDDASGAVLAIEAAAGNAPASLRQVARLLGERIARLFPDGAGTPEVRADARGGMACAYAEFESNDGPDRPGASVFVRAWLFARAGVLLSVTYCCPTAGRDADRAAVDRVVASVEITERPPLSPGEFLSLALDLAAGASPGRRVEAAPDFGLLVDGETYVPLGNVYSVYLHSGGDAVAFVRRLLDRMIRAASRAERLTFAQARPLIRPALKRRDLLTGVNADLIHAPYVADLVVTFVLDYPHTMDFITQGAMRRWKVGLSEVYRAAQENFATYSMPYEVIEADPGRVVVFTSADGYAATRLLHPDFYTIAASRLGEEFLVGVPDRNSLAAFSLSPREFRLEMLAEIVAEYERMEYPISPSAYHVSEYGIAEYTEGSLPIEDGSFDRPSPT
ncbi:MAG: DUF1444 family protein [Planctomycetes bacterium]|nr:DUF1444 family protein [Planctomycetota bacterium]